MCRLFVGADPSLWESHTRSVRLAGMVTSVRLEQMFWLTLKEMASRDGVGVPQLMQNLYEESLAEGHDMRNFTSFLRVCCLRFIDLQLNGLLPRDDASDFQALSADEILKIEAQNRGA